MKRWPALVAATILAAGAARTQAPPALPTDQADAGATLYGARCATCHGDTLTGGDHGPALKGAAFWKQWQNAPARPLYSRILSTMPMNDPGSLSPDEALALVAHIARANGRPLAVAVGSPAELNAITLAPGAP